MTRLFVEQPLTSPGSAKKNLTQAKSKTGLNGTFTGYDLILVQLFWQYSWTFVLHWPAIYSYLQLFTAIYSPTSVWTVDSPHTYINELPTTVVREQPLTNMSSSPLALLRSANYQNEVCFFTSVVNQDKLSGNTSSFHPSSSALPAGSGHPPHDLACPRLHPRSSQNPRILPAL